MRFTLQVDCGRRDPARAAAGPGRARRGPGAAPLAMADSARLVLKPGPGEVPAPPPPVDLLRRHRARRGRSPQPGDTVAVVAHDGAPLAWAAWSPSSQIRARVWSFDPGARIDEAFLAARLEAAVARRARLLDEGHDACRLVHSESDGLPGLVVDRYGDTAVVQLLSAGAERWRDFWPEAIARVAGVRARLRALRRGGAHARGARAARRADAGRCARHGAHARGGPRLRGGRGARPEDGLLPRPARQPRAGGPRSRRAARS